MSDDARQNLVAGLVGDRTDLFHNSAHFYYSVNALADMLPYWIDGIAAQAEKMDAEIETQLDLIRRTDT